MNCLDRLHQTKKRGLVPCSLYLTLITSKVKHHFMTLCWRISVGKFAFFNSSLNLSLAKIFFFQSRFLMYGGCLSIKKVWTLQICIFQNVATELFSFSIKLDFCCFSFLTNFLSRATNIAVHFLGLTHKWYPSQHSVTPGSKFEMSWFQKVLTSKSK